MLKKPATRSTNSPTTRVLRVDLNSGLTNKHEQEREQAAKEILGDKYSVYSKFAQEVRFDEERYEAN